MCYLSHFSEASSVCLLQRDKNFSSLMVARWWATCGFYLLPRLHWEDVASEGRKLCRWPLQYPTCLRLCAVVVCVYLGVRKHYLVQWRSIWNSETCIFAFYHFTAGDYWHSYWGLTLPFHYSKCLVGDCLLFWMSLVFWNQLSEWNNWFRCSFLNINILYNDCRENKHICHNSYSAFDQRCTVFCAKHRRTIQLACPLTYLVRCLL